MHGWLLMLQLSASILILESSIVVYLKVMKELQRVLSAVRMLLAQCRGAVLYTDLYSFPCIASY